MQQVGPINWQKLSGVTQPINAAQVFVISPLSRLAPTDPALAAALATYRSAPAAQQQKWATAYGTAVTMSSSSTAPRWCPGPATGPSRR